MSSVNKITAERSQRVLLDLVSKPGNDVCADCKARAPRWASHNLGIFLCMSCASIHRKIGTHVTKVKSITMDSWSKEQVEVMKSIGNIASNAKYNPNEVRHPPPTNFEESERDSELEKYIRSKYEFKRFKETPASRAPPPPKSTPARAQSTPATSVARSSSPVPAVPARHGPGTSKAPESRPYSASGATAASSQPQPAITPRPSISVTAPPVLAQTSQQPAPPNNASSNPVWNDMMSLAGPMPSQLSSQSAIQTQQTPYQPSSHASPVHPYGTAPPGNPFSSFPGHSPSRTSSLPIPINAGPSFQTQSPQQALANPFFTSQQATGFPGQMAGSAFQPSPSGAIPIQSGFGQLQPSPSPFSHSYTPPSSFPQQPLQQSFAPSSFPQQQFVHPQHTPVQQPVFSQQQPPAMQWQQQTGFSGQHSGGFPGHTQYGQWGAM